jgi:uncharacterized GH25 family protein
MKKPSLWHITALAAALTIALPMTAQAARLWIVPSATVVPNIDAYVTIDASASDDLFNIGRALPLENIVIAGPGGTTITPENPLTGKQRSSFELKLAEAGTYKIALLSDSLNASYKVNGEMKRWRGSSAETFAKEVPADAQDVNVSRMQGRLETFVTVGKSTLPSWKSSRNGLELLPLTPPTDLFTGDTSSFRLLLDGKPAADLPVTIVLGNNRYRDALGELTLKTDKNGKFSVKWPSAGMYWLNASVGGAPGAVGTLTQPIRRVSYSATLEVLQP